MGITRIDRRVYTKPNDSIESEEATEEDKLLADQFLNAAADGNLRKIKKLVKEMELDDDDDHGRGTSERIRHVRGFNSQGLLHVAAKRGRINVCKYLVEDLKIPLDDKDTEGLTPLLLATVDGHLSTMQYLVDNGADIAATNNCKSTALHLSAALGNIGMMRYLLSKGLDVNALNAFGTPLDSAAIHNKRDALKLLLDHGANPNIVTTNPSPLAITMENSLYCAKLLIQAGADPNGISCGVTPLTFAAKRGAVNVIKFLLGAGADPNISDNIGLKPIEMAAYQGHLQAVKILFPVTTHIPTYSNWSISGIMEHIKSEDFANQVKLRHQENHIKAKSNGDEALKRKDYLLASLYYDEALTQDPSSAAVLSSRSLCYACDGDAGNALADAEACIKLRPDWPEAYYRKGVALKLLGELDMAADAFLSGLKKDPENKELRQSFREAVQAKFNSFDV